MKKSVLLILLAASLALSQEHAAPGPEDASHGGAAAVHPGGAADTHAEAAAKHGEGHGSAMPNEIWWKWANFVLFAGALGWLLRKHAGPFFASRTAEIQSGIAAAARTRSEAEARAAEIERRVSNLSAEMDELRHRSKEEMAREGERIRAETAQQIRKVQAQAEAEIASAAKHATQDLKGYAASLALQLAEKQISQQMNESAQTRLTEDFVSDLRQKAVPH